MKTFKVTDTQYATIVASLLRYSIYWQDKADRGTEGRAGCQANADEASSLYHWLLGMDVHLPVIAAPSQPTTKRAAPSGPQGGATIQRKPVPPAPPSGDKLQAVIDKVPFQVVYDGVKPRTEQTDIDF